MRRKDREITDTTEIYKIMDQCTSCRVGFCDDGEVYIVPLNFGYERNGEHTTLYFHGASVGRKIDLIKKTGSAGFEMDTNYILKPGEIACTCTASFQSIIGNGLISIITDADEKKKGLEAIMYHNTKRKGFTYDEALFAEVCVFKIEVTKLSCKFHE